MSKEKKGLGLFGLLGLVSLVLGFLAVGVYALQAFDVVDLLPKRESVGAFVLYAVLGLPAAAMVLGFLGSKFADSGSTKGKCFGIALGGALLLAFIAWLIFGRAS
jgi:uncharacterized membrane protein YuzA (DUF378 family)